MVTRTSPALSISASVCRGHCCLQVYVQVWPLLLAFLMKLYRKRCKVCTGKGVRYVLHKIRCQVIRIFCRNTVIMLMASNFSVHLTKELLKK